MKTALAFIASEIPAIGCVVIAGWLAAHGLDGWGWFLFGAIMLSSSVRLSSKSSDDEDEEGK